MNWNQIEFGISRIGKNSIQITFKEDNIPKFISLEEEYKFLTDFVKSKLREAMESVVPNRYCGECEICNQTEKDCPEMEPYNRALSKIKQNIDKFFEEY